MVLLRALLALSLVLSLLLPAWPARAESHAPTVAARAWVLMDGQTGQVLYAGSPDSRQYPASTTKLLTALVAAEHGDLAGRHTVPPEALDLPGDSTLCELQAGEEQTLEALLHGLLLPSGNDCALAIALGLAGTEGRFVSWMNQRAAALGLTHSHFSNPHGLHDPDLFTTARDLATIARAAFANPVVRRIAGTPAYTMPGHEPFANGDRLLLTYPGMVGGKTGFTDEAGCTLVAAAERDGRYLIGVLVGEKSMARTFSDMTHLLDYGFQAFQAMAAVTAGESFAPLSVGAASVPVDAAGSFAVSVAAARPALPAELRVAVRALPDVAAPIRAGQVVGAADVLLGQQLLGSVDLVAAAGTEAALPAVAASVAAAPVPAWEEAVARWALYGGVGVAALLVVNAWRRRRRRTFRHR